MKTGPRPRPHTGPDYRPDVPPGHDFKLAPRSTCRNAGKDCEPCNRRVAGEERSLTVATSRPLSTVRTSQSPEGVCRTYSHKRQATIITDHRPRSTATLMDMPRCSPREAAASAMKKKSSFSHKSIYFRWDVAGTSSGSSPVQGGSGDRSVKRSLPSRLRGVMRRRSPRLLVTFRRYNQRRKKILGLGGEHTSVPRKVCSSALRLTATLGGCNKAPEPPYARDACLLCWKRTARVLPVRKCEAAIGRRTEGTSAWPTVRGFCRDIGGMGPSGAPRTTLL